MSQRRMSYTASEKLAIVKRAEAHGSHAAGRQYDGILSPTFGYGVSRRSGWKRCHVLRKITVADHQFFPEM